MNETLQVRPRPNEPKSSGFRGQTEKSYMYLTMHALPRTNKGASTRSGAAIPYICAKRSEFSRNAKKLEGALKMKNVGLISQISFVG
jgi:hypothetical protein